MMILDTNVLSALMQTQPDVRVAAWIDTLPEASIWTTTITIFEVRSGLLAMVKGRRQKLLQAAFEHALTVELDGRVLDFDRSAAEVAASISTKLRTSGRSIEIRDAMISGIAASHNAQLATRNTKHFQHTQVSLVNPWDFDSRPSTSA